LQNGKREKLMKRIKYRCLFLSVLILVSITGWIYAQTDKANLDEIYMQAVNTYYSGDYSEAVSLFKKIQKIDSDYRKMQVERFIRIAETRLGLPDKKDESDEEEKEKDAVAGDIIKLEVFHIDVIAELPEFFLIKPEGKLPQIDADKIYANLFSLEEQGVLKVVRGEFFVESGKTRILDTRKVIPGTDEKEGSYFEATPEIKKNGNIACYITLLISRLVEMKTITVAGHADKVIPIMSTQESSSHVVLVPDKPAILGGTIGTIGMTAIGGPKIFNMLKASIYVKPKVSIEFRHAKTEPAEGFSRYAAPPGYRHKELYVKDKSDFSDEYMVGGVRLLEPHDKFIEESGRAHLEIPFTEEGLKKFAELTERLIGEYLVILVDGEVVSAPIVKEKISGGGRLILPKETIDKILGK
jgi:hypothetical protein